MLAHIPPPPSSSMYIPMSGNLNVITLKYWYTYMYQCTYSMIYSKTEYNILPLICFEVMYCKPTIIRDNFISLFIQDELVRGD